jgi:hypothetical protein
MNNELQMYGRRPLSLGIYLLQGEEPVLEASRLSASQEIPCILCKLKLLDFNMSPAEFILHAPTCL